jgi:hypothetical protein
LLLLLPPSSSSSLPFRPPPDREPSLRDALATCVALPPSCSSPVIGHSHRRQILT